MFIFVGTGTPTWVSALIFLASVILPRVSSMDPTTWSQLVFGCQLASVGIVVAAIGRARSLDVLDPRLWSAGLRSAVLVAISVALPHLVMYPSVWSGLMWPARMLVHWGISVPVLLTSLAALGNWDWQQWRNRSREFFRRLIMDMVQPGNDFERPAPAANPAATALSLLASRLNAMPVEAYCSPKVIPCPPLINDELPYMVLQRF
jgi:hypothetical protein